MIVETDVMIRARDICKKYGAWLLVDNAYEYFYFGDLTHKCVTGPHVVHIFSLSKVKFH